MGYILKSLISALKRMKISKEDVIDNVIAEYDKTEAEAKELVEKYWESL